MLNTLRQGAKGWVSKILMGLLVLSFAVWGVGGFEGYGAGTLATVGGEEVTVEDYARLYDQAQRLAQQSGQRVNADQVLGQLLLGAALDDEANRYGLGISDDRVAAEIAKSPEFHDASGAFDRERFNVLLLNARMDPDAYIEEVRRGLVRSQFAGSIDAGLQVPQPMVEALYRLRNEERTISYVVVDETAIEPVGEPTEAELQAYFEDNKSRYRAPEYRQLALITLDADTLADPAAVTEDEVQAEYRTRAANLAQPERRRVEQITFDSADAANEALGAIDAGEDFAAAAAAHGGSVTDLGLKARVEFLDPAVAEAAFAAGPNVAVAVTENALQPSVIRVTEIETGSTPSLEELEPRIRKDLATRAARSSLSDLYDQVEDERAGGATLEEAAKSLELPYRVVDAVSAAGATPDGGQVTDIPNQREVLQEAFLTEIGIENSPIRADGDSWVFYDVTDITPARDRTLDEVREQALADWRLAETEKRIAEKADALLERLRAGEPLATLAAEIGKSAATVEGVKRGAAPAGLTGNAVNQAFAGPEGHAANADGEGSSRILVRVDRVIAPAFFAETADAQQISEQLSGALQNDVVAIFNQQIGNSRSVDINNAIYRQLVGQLSGEAPPQQ